MALTATQQYWANHLQQADTFAGSAADYARSQGLSPKVLYQWRGLLRRRGVYEAARPAFAEVVTAVTAHTSILTLTLGQAQLHFDTLPDETWLARLIRAHG